MTDAPRWLHHQPSTRGLGAWLCPGVGLGSGAGLPRPPTVTVGHTEPGATLCFLGLLLLLLLVLLGRCVRVLLDPYRSLVAGAWSGHRGAVERQGLDPGLV